jgi:hypothetical protein
MMAAFADEIAAAGVPTESLIGGAAAHLASANEIGANVFEGFANSV